MSSVALEVEPLMANYPSVVNASKKLPKAKHQVKHVIETTCPHPLKAHYHHLDKDKLTAAKAEFLAKEQQGIVRTSRRSIAHGGHAGTTGSSIWPPSKTCTCHCTSRTCPPSWRA